MTETWFLLALGAAMFSATSNTFDKVLINYLHPWTIPAIKKFINGSILLVASWIFFDLYFPVDFDFWIFVLILAIPEFLATLFYFSALKQGDASRIVPYGQSIVVALPFIFAILFLSENVSVFNIAGVLLIAAGVGVILSNGSFTRPKASKGLIFITISAILQSIYLIFIKMGTSEFPPYLLAAYMFFIGDFFILALNFKYKRKEQLDSFKKIFNFKIGLVLLLACLGASLSTLFIYLALKEGNASEVIPLTKASPLFLILMSGAILKEKRILVKLLGAALIVAGIFAIYN